MNLFLSLLRLRRFQRAARVGQVLLDVEIRTQLDVTQTLRS